MPADQNRYWPFEDLPPQRSEVQFLESAHQAGFKPYMFGAENFGATAEPRGGIILYRGGRGKHWEVLLGTTAKTILSAHVDNFDHAANAVLRWLRGAEADAIVDFLEGNLVVTPATGEGFVLHSREQQCERATSFNRTKVPGTKFGTN